MTIKPRKQRSDSVAAQVAMAQAKPLSVAIVEKTEAQYLNDILKSKPQDSWTPNDLNVAKLLARSIKHFEQIQTQLFEQGSTIINKQGNIVLNPIQAAVTQTATGINKLMSSIGLTASQRGTKAGELKEQWQVEAKAKGWDTQDQTPKSNFGDTPNWSQIAQKMREDDQ